MVVRMSPALVLCVLVNVGAALNLAYLVRAWRRYLASRRRLGAVRITDPMGAEAERVALTKWDAGIDRFSTPPEGFFALLAATPVQYRRHLRKRLAIKALQTHHKEVLGNHLPGAVSPAELAEWSTVHALLRESVAKAGALVDECASAIPVALPVLLHPLLLLALVTPSTYQPVTRPDSDHGPPPGRLVAARPAAPHGPPLVVASDNRVTTAVAA